MSPSFLVHWLAVTAESSSAARGPQRVKLTEVLCSKELTCLF